MSGSTRVVALGSGCLAALGWGLTGTFIKLMPQFTTLEILTVRLVIALLATLPILIMRRSLQLELRSLVRNPQTILLSSLMVFYYLFAVRAFQLAPVSDVVLIVGLAPLLGLTVKVLSQKPILAMEGIGAITSFGGLVLFVLPKLQGHSSDITTYLTGLFFAFLSAIVTLTYATLFKFQSINHPLLNPLLVAFITFALGSVITLPITLIATPQYLNALVQPDMLAIAWGLGILSTVVPTLCYSYAAKHLSPVLTTTLNLMTPIFAAAIAALFLHEYLPLLSIIGAILILTGILMLSMPQRFTASFKNR
ncbi:MULTISPECIES: DMT family transporter [unclassified Leptolyngbya]|uniref:DMT family transporter n=1 Tax=unclassified Leptolyngbya TaxID=2650499 RepID=UPI0016867D84|nr:MULTISPECIES: DMT family transporter [unclassified Leptolyngbya]MBD1909084.1 DMT family transporter [Leptolyngbya sp. FACHB-8]MBD2157005.1 DMT family transporter [Leptolyngbya sp. FACHB-16]